ncbi:hypothetical protein RclHR1_08910007 [Rhizophagus clarus]|uniref:F-box domain-containing protein n=1 Tax=Rhizophagus clarus TaxID=94130 RepID=A0A2Z6S8Q6_9GLOM|nr:hypothetical protein RclHR1_08910007 [Rhizophagus clarus]GES92460.1 hypothetical protein GLOIN_2v1835443 [Rhizophagus clarus]
MQDVSAVNSSITNIPLELFIEVCSFLSPADLFTLSQVCRKFRGCLCAPNSFNTQQIWKESRLKFMPKEDLPPPEGMSEEKYAELLVTERGCQICKRTKECKIYWEFTIRCCKRCFYKKTISRIELIMKIKCPLEFINIMPCAHVGYFFCEKYYWKEQVDLAYSQYYGLSKKRKKNWLKDKKQEFDSIMNYVRQRELRKEKARYFQGHFLSPYTYWDTMDDLLYFYSQPSLSYPLFPSLPSPPPSPPLSRFFVQSVIKEVKKVEKVEKVNNNDVTQLIEHHIKRLESESHQTTFNERSVSDYLENSNEQRRNNFVKPKNKQDKFNMKMKGENFKNKFAYKYG